MNQIKDWNKANKEGAIDIPNHLDELVNKVGMQLRFHTISGKNEVQTICDIVYGVEAHFEKLHNVLPSHLDSGKAAKEYSENMTSEGEGNGFHELDFYNGTVWLRSEIEENKKNKIK